MIQWPVLSALLAAIVLFSVASLLIHVVDGRPERGMPRLVWHQLGAFFTVAGVEAATLLVTLQRPVWISQHRWVLVAVYSAVALVMASWLVLRMVARQRRPRWAPATDDLPHEPPPPAS